MKIHFILKTQTGKKYLKRKTYYLYFKQFSQSTYFACVKLQWSNLWIKMQQPTVYFFYKRIKILTVQILDIKSHTRI